MASGDCYVRLDELDTLVLLVQLVLLVLLDYLALPAQKKRELSLRTLFCDSAGARTQDPILKRDVLYLLSY